MLSSFFSFAIYPLYFVSTLAVPSSTRNKDEDGVFTISLPGHENFTIPEITLPGHPLNASNVAVECFTNPPAPARPIYERVSAIDCLSIFLPIFLVPDVMESVNWTPYEPLWLPYDYTGGDCKIEISTRFANAKDRFQEVAILQRAALVLDQCFRQRRESQWFGGTVSVGPKGAFQVTVVHL